ncbi:MAG: TonB-dependent receptor [Agarilytica sp.]
MKAVFILSLPFLASMSFADHSHQVEEVFVDGQKISSMSTTLDVSEQNVVDTSQVLKIMPGANVNRNGALTGIAQYRGLFGDRVAVTIDGSEVVSGGPNAMDSPLSYASPMITESITVDRGIASVSKAPESMGGHISAKMARGKYNDTSDFDFSGFFGSRYNTVGDQSVVAGRLTGASDAHRISLLAEVDRGDDIETPAGVISPSEMSRDRADLSYGYKSEDADFLIYGGVLDTTDAGTPALAMDIRSIETDLAGLQYSRKTNEQLRFGVVLNTNDVEHWMDNFSLRTAPANMMMFRQNFATGEGTSGKLYGELVLDFAMLGFGLTAKQAEHNSTITNPNAAAFEVINFNNIERDNTSVYVELIQSTKKQSWEVGASYNRVATNAGDVGASGMMGMMGTNAGLLADGFNTADRDLDFNNANVVAKYAYSLNDDTKMLVEVGSKARAPSHQELYLWLPLQATGGLADGRSYIGNVNLDSERSNEINVGFEYKTDTVQIAPQIFYKKINDYIQGTAATNMTANMVSTMMSGAAALQFNNIDAKISGLDVAWNYSISDAFFLEGVASIVNAERADEDDYLYRQSPNNLRTALHYAENNVHVTLENHIYQSQNDVSEYNAEQESAGYGLINLRVSWQPIDSLSLEARADNLADKQYQDHLAGVNRVMAVDIPQGERLYGAERSFTAGVRYNF